MLDDRSSNPSEPDLARFPIDGELRDREKSKTLSNVGYIVDQVQSASVSAAKQYNIKLQNTTAGDRLLGLNPLHELLKMGEIAKLQTEDTSLKKCYDSLREGKGGYFLEKGILYKNYTSNTHNSTCDNKKITRNALLVIPLLLRTSLI